MRKLTLDDIADQRAYERERTDFRAHVIALKKRRRVGVGPFVTFLFENRDTVRFQVQEMARAERILTDAEIQVELDVHNPMIPDPGNLAATMFLELTSEPALRTWLPKLVGIERSVAVRFDAPTVPDVRCTVDPEHEEQLTREEVTASVHYVHFAFSPEQILAFGAGAVTLVVDHPEYAHEARLSADTVAELAADLVV